MKKFLLAFPLLLTAFNFACASSQVVKGNPNSANETVVVNKSKFVEQEPEVLASKYTKGNECYMAYRKSVKLPADLGATCAEPKPKEVVYASYFIGTVLASKDKEATTGLLAISDVLSFSKDSNMKSKFEQYVQFVAEERNDERHHMMSVVNKALTNLNCYDAAYVEQQVREGYNCVADVKSDKQFDDLYSETFMFMCKKDLKKTDKECEKLRTSKSDEFHKLLAEGMQSSKMQ